MGLEIDVFTGINGIPDEAINNKAVIVIDVLRATTTISVALAAGCLEVIPVLTPEEAIDMRERLEDERVLLGGERNALKIPGFDLGNSPLEYTPEIVAGKRLIMTTTNGTRAIRRAAGGRQVFLGAMINAPAVAGLAAAAATDITIICAGTRDRFSLEDFLAAGLLVDRLAGLGEFVLRDGALTARDYYYCHRDDPSAAMKASFHGRLLADLGLEADVEFCSRVGAIDVVPVYGGGIIKKAG
ncbi:MAG: 2-phosphosulfolactate phosphatase [Moorella sp. (in: firmicutes)]|uniref:2-phosphosulfolactate phosphatase n=1 Tax=unclassified Neomoorella TaxID=2676739 RepID=UPI0010FFB5ED|nr:MULTISPECIES: 2-phosphosulfolactate phosphatase [unclassified Moorella (in: firmicutes)]MDK2816529.1 2-phosphosulfolactate phosphatase [Moorella sp. (in: firmicutes)]MDK2895042.1 2-phosphosulfolactate phosphatase [Moorella sp. (in: firmicutes)]GEA14583.1 putative 2-phosphosulfolactate phosphatase [Moorella sp. E308F]GEA18046.1 putative 2-phosphosulfolactate phosphatase [Moorella sp. E306M]